MQVLPITIVLALTGAVLILVSKPLTGLAVYTLLLLWYPVSLWIPLGTLSFNVNRVAILALFVSLRLRGEHGGFRLTRVDKLLLAFWCAQIISGMFTTDLMVLLINRSGTFFDTALPYFALRIILKDQTSIKRYLRTLAVAVIVLCVVGLLESVANISLLHLNRPPHMMEGRMGLERARASFGHPIYFGISMVALMSVLMSLWQEGRAVSLLPAGAAGVGALMSMSSGAVLALVATAAALSFYRWRRYWKTAIWVALVMCVAVEVLSNRHFFEVIDRLAFEGRNAWYRTRLIEVAFFEGGMRDHWLFGYGYGVDPMWGSRIDGRGFTDIVNYYVLVLVQFGLSAFVPFLILIFTVVKGSLAHACRLVGPRAWTQWCFLSALLGLLFAINSVSLFSQSHHVFYMILALCESYRCLTSKPVVVTARPNRRVRSAVQGGPVQALPEGGR